MWLFAVTIWLAGCAVGIIAATFIVDRRILASVASAALLMCLAGIALLFLKGGEALGGILLCVTLSIVICQAGLNFTWPEPIKREGKWGDLVGKEGTTLTFLGPKGTVMVEDREIPAATEGNFLAEGERIRIVRSGERLVIVEKLET